jgi:hypothetical protein
MKLVRKILNGIVYVLCRKSQWRKDYYHYLVNCNFGGWWKRYIKPEFDKLLDERPDLKKNVFINWYIHIDARLSYLFLGAEHEDYFFYEMYKHGWIYNNKIVTRTRMNVIKEYLNNPKKRYYLDDKNEFAKIWGKKYFKQKWCNLKECSRDNFIKIFKDCDEIVVKDAMGRGGNGITFIKVNDNLGELYDKYYSEECSIIVEEYYHQKGFLHDVNPSSLNTIRVTTLREYGKAKVLFSYFRAGGSDSNVDNLHSGGVLYFVDISTGELLDGTIRNGKRFYSHPGTNIKVTGRKIPNWDKVKNTCEEAHLLAPKGLEMIAWDVCESEGEVFLIEGNAGPMFSRPISKNDNPWRNIKRYMDRNFR